MLYRCLLLASVVLAAGCHPGPVVNTGAKQPSVGGTIAGIVRTADSSVAVPGRKVTAVETTSGQRYDTTTATNGGYTIRVPEGTYRIEIELRPGETLAKQPEATNVSNSDVDAGRDFVITAKPAR